MWPDDKATWISSPRHSYLQLCEQRRLMPHPRLLQFTDPASPIPAPSRVISAQSAPLNHFIAAFGFIAEHIFLGDAGLEASIPLIRKVLTSEVRSGQQLHLISVGITRKGVGSLGAHLQLWSSAAETNLRVADVDLSGNDISATSVQISPLRSMHPILRTPHIRRLVLSGCR
jgi:hypothetical protein